MFRNSLLCAVASVAMFSAGALAHPGGGAGGGMGGPPGGMGGMGNGGGFGLSTPGGVGDIGGMGASMRDQSRLNSQGPLNASSTGIAHANSNSVLSGSSTTTLDRMFPGTRTTTSVNAGPLAGLTTGMTLMSNGTAVGTVQQIRTTGNGAVRVVIVQGSNGGFYAVPASKLAVSGGVLSTTMRLAGVNGTSTSQSAMSSQARLNSQGPVHASATGLAHANSHSVLAGAATSASVPASGMRRNSQGPLHASATGIAHANSHSVLAGSSSTSTNTMMSQARLNSQGSLHASATGIAHANSHSVLAGASSTALTGISVGMPFFSNGTQVGTVYRVVSANGVITRVLVQATSGRVYSLAPSALVASGGTITTTRKLRGS